MSTTWSSTSPTPGRSITITGGVTVTVSGQADITGAVALDGATTGKLFYSVTLGSGGSDVWAIGLANSSETSWAGASVNSIGTDGTGVYYNGFSLGGVIGGPLVTGDVIDIAVDLGAGKFWARKNGGNWNGTAAADPAAGSGGITGWSISGTLYPYIDIYQNGALTANFGASSYTYAKPTGFADFGTTSSRSFTLAATEAPDVFAATMSTSQTSRAFTLAATEAPDVFSATLSLGDVPAAPSDAVTAQASALQAVTVTAQALGSARTATATPVQGGLAA